MPLRIVLFIGFDSDGHMMAIYGWLSRAVSSYEYVPIPNGEANT